LKNTEKDKRPVLKQSKTHWLSLAQGLEKVKTRTGRELTVTVFSIQLEPNIVT